MIHPSIVLDDQDAQRHHETKERRAMRRERKLSTKRVGSK